MPRPLAAVNIALLLFSLPNVITFATLSCPYTWRSLLKTSPRLDPSISTSTSNTETRLGLRKRQGKVRVVSHNGLIWVISNKYNRIKPTPEPRPGPTIVPASQHTSIIFCKLRKYADQ